MVDFGLPPPPIAEDASTFEGLEVDLFLACYLCDVLVASKTAQEAPKRPQDPPKTAQEAPKRPQDPPKSAQRGSKRPPRAPQEAPRRPQETIFESQWLSKCRNIFPSTCHTHMFSEKQPINSKDALLRCPGTNRRAGMPKDGGRAAVSPQRGRQSAARTEGEGRTAC